MSPFIKALLLVGLAAHTKAQPKVMTRDGDVVLASPTDVRVVRQDPEGTGAGRSASLFQLLDQVAELDDTIADSVATATSTLRGESAEQARMLQANLSALATNLNAALDARLDDFDDVLSDVLDNRVADVQAAITITNATLRRSIAMLEMADAESTRADAANAACFAAGKVITATGCAYPPILTERSAGYDCTNITLGRTRWNTNTSAYEICSPGAPAAAGVPTFGFQDLFIPNTHTYGEQSNPATSGAALKARRPDAASGIFWIQPPGDSTAAQTYCDMTYRGGGWCLANVGYVASTGVSRSNKALNNMNRPGGYRWNPNNRASTSMLISLPSGGVNMAKASTHMMMAAGNNPNSGGINSYSHAYEISISHVTQYLNFQNGNRYHLGCTSAFGNARNQNIGFVVRGVKGDIGTWNKRAQRESMMISWGDSYPTGYGFSAGAISAGTYMRCYGGFNDGPFFPSLHSGDGHPSQNRWGARSSPPDISYGNDWYTHGGWYGANAMNRRGQTSLWFK
jgi:hypothetical protein